MVLRKVFRLSANKTKQNHPTAKSVQATANVVRTGPQAEAVLISINVATVGSFDRPGQYTLPGLTRHYPNKLL